MSYKVYSLSGPAGELRLHVKSFRSKAAHAKFLGQKHRVRWLNYWGKLPTGTYRHSGEAWVKAKEVACA